MKYQYLQEVTGQIENVNGETFVIGTIHKIELDLVERTRIFINQLLPDILNRAKTPEEIETAFDILRKDAERFIKRLERAEMYLSAEMVANATHETVSELSEKYKEAVNHE